MQYNFIAKCQYKLQLRTDQQTPKRSLISTLDLLGNLFHRQLRTENIAAENTQQLNLFTSVNLTAKYSYVHWETKENLFTSMNLTSS